VTVTTWGGAATDKLGNNDVSALVFFQQLSACVTV
jgi:hypothetical protein